MTKSYEDGIIDALGVLNSFTSVGVYTVPVSYIEEALINHLPSGYKLDLINIKGNLKKSREVLNNV